MFFFLYVILTALMEIKYENYILHLPKVHIYLSSTEVKYQFP